MKLHEAKYFFNTPLSFKCKEVFLYLDQNKVSKELK